MQLAATAARAEAWRALPAIVCEPFCLLDHADDVGYFGLHSGSAHSRGASIGIAKRKGVGFTRFR